MIGHLITDAEVQALVIIPVKIVGDAGLGVGHLGKNRPLAPFEHLGFEPGPQAFGLGIIVAVAAAALRAQGPVLAEQGTVDIATVLPALPGTTPVGVDDQARGGRLAEKSPLQGGGHQFFGHTCAHAPADHVLGAHILKGTEVGPTGYDPVAVGLGGLGLVEQRPAIALACFSTRGPV
ncbi:hypothetical protein HBN54_002225 [Hymenobacter sp. 1B]|uniref:Uncharacterized protein n=1 Tax=Hymenobacter artigasi TaxID=2719616 RepID=A0ABX1HKE5_9BACT|nr:hypothetical protein [Hymenobacter artigasi]NKI89627.1 hypothetical protein [Hymenobacter artigasi]